MGYQHWDQVEGALLRFLVSGPLYWLGTWSSWGATNPSAGYFAPVRPVYPLPVAITIRPFRGRNRC